MDIKDQSQGEDQKQDEMLNTPNNETVQRTEILQPETTSSEQVVLPTKQPKPTRKKLVLGFMILAIISIVAMGSLAAYYFIYKASVSDTQNAASTNEESESNVISHGSVLVYKADNDDESASSMSIIGLDGKTINSFTTSYSQGISNITGEDSFTIVNNETSSGFSILAPDGKTTPIPASLNEIVNSNKRLLVGESTSLSIENSDNYRKESFVKTDLISGETMTILEAEAVQGATAQSSHLLDIFTTSSDGSKAYLLSGTSHKTVIIDSTTTSGVNLITVDLLSGKYTLKALPDICYGFCSISKDGNKIAYPSYSSVGEDSQLATMHIYDVLTGKDVAVSTNGFTASKSSTNLAFSRDGLYLSVDNTYIVENANKQDIQIISVATGAVIHQIDPVGSDSVYIDVLGWSGDHSLVYDNTDTNDWDNGPWANNIHSIDAATGEISDILKSSSNMYHHWYSLINY